MANPTYCSRQTKNRRRKKLPKLITREGKSCAEILLFFFFFSFTFLPETQHPVQHRSKKKPQKIIKKKGKSPQEILFFFFFFASTFLPETQKPDQKKKKKKKRKKKKKKKNLLCLHFRIHWSYRWSCSSDTHPISYRP